MSSPPEGAHSTRRIRMRDLQHMVQIGFRKARALYIFGIIAMAIGSVATAAQPAVVGYAADTFLINNGSVRLSIIILIVLFVVDAAGATFGRLALGIASERFVFNVRSAFSTRLVNSAIEKFRRYDRGDINNRVVEDIPLFQRPYFSIFPELFSSILLVVLCFGGMFVASWRLSLALIIVLAIFGVFLVVVLAKIQKNAKDSRESEASYSSFLYEILYNIFPIKAMGANNIFIRKLDDRAESARKIGVRLVGYSSLIMPVVSIGTQVGIVGVLVLGGALTVRGDLAPGALASFFLYLIYVITPLVTIATSLGELKESRVSKDRLEVLHEDLNPGDFHLHSDGASSGVAEIHTSGVTYSFPNGKTITYSDISIVGNGIHGLAGPNGVGKTTFLTLVSGLVRPQRGRIHVSSGESKPRAFEGRPYYLTQDRDVFSLSVRENILMGLERTDECVLSAAEALGVRGFIEGLPQWLDTLLGAEGISLSGGQKQILFAINLLLAKPSIALLDEIASNLDTTVKDNLLGCLAEMSADSLIVFVTHDPDVLRRCDNFIELKSRVTSS